MKARVCDACDKRLPDELAGVNMKVRAPLVDGRARQTADPMGLWGIMHSSAFTVEVEADACDVACVAEAVLKALERAKKAR